MSVKIKDETSMAPSNFNWDNFHFTCSGCGQPVEHGNEAPHYSGDCLPQRFPKTRTEPKKKRIGRLLRRRVFERDAYRCKHCNGWIDLCADHIIPESKGGATTYENLQTLCRSCNSRKGTK